MGEQKRQRAPGRDRIDVNDPDGLRLWTLSLGVSEAELRRAVDEAGTQVEKVREYLQRRH